jgi:hypothetical protein
MRPQTLSYADTYAATIVYHKSSLLLWILWTLAFKKYGTDKLRQRSYLAFHADRPKKISLTLDINVNLTSNIHLVVILFTIFCSVAFVGLLRCFITCFFTI